MTKPKIKLPDYSNYTLPERKPGVPITREHYNLGDRIMMCLQDNYPDAPPALVRSTASMLYSLAGWVPSENPNPEPFMENQVVHYIQLYLIERMKHED